MASFFQQGEDIAHQQFYCRHHRILAEYHYRVVISKILLLFLLFFVLVCKFLELQPKID